MRAVGACLFALFVVAFCDDAPQTGSGLAWDKHDFEVTNNKGGDVSVEVNLAAPMSGIDGDDDEEGGGEDITEVLKLLTPEDPVNPIELMSMMKELMVSMRSEEPTESVNVTEILQEFKETIKEEKRVSEEIVQQQQQQQQVQQASLPPPINITELVLALRDQGPQYLPVPVAPPQPGFSPEMIINALQPPPQPQQPFDISGFMKEMREVVSSNKAPPTPPPGLDPQLLDLVRDTMSMVKDMKTQAEVVAASPSLHQPPPIMLPPPTPAVAPSPEPIVVPHIFMPPPAPPPSTAAGTVESVKDDIQSILASHIKPPVVPVSMPPPTKDPEIEQLKQLLQNQQLSAQRPIILPAPVVVTKSLEASALAPPPPPPPPAHAASNTQTLKEMIASMMPKPQRIPAPPKISFEHQQAGAKDCCPAPQPEDRRPDTERCPAANGVARPRCKRLKPPQVQTSNKSCARPPCSNVDNDGDLMIGNDELWPGALPSNMPAASFNPEKLLKLLCPGGHCPGQKDLEPKQNPRLAAEQPRSES